MLLKFVKIMLAYYVIKNMVIKLAQHYSTIMLTSDGTCVTLSVIRTKVPHHTHTVEAISRILTSAWWGHDEDVF